MTIEFDTSPTAPRALEDAESALREPTPTELFRQEAGPRRGLVLLLVLATIGAGAAQMSAALLTLTLKASVISGDAATTTISISSGIAGLFTLFALPIVGSLSDRSRSVFGRRRPFLVAASVAFAAGGTLLILAPNVALFVVAHLLITTGFVAAGVTITALIADQLPPERRGSATAFLSIGTPVGALFGMAVAVPFGDQLVPLIGIPTALAVGTLLLLVVMLRDPKFDEPRAAFDLRRLVGVFWVNPVRHPAFAFIFTSRMLVFSAVAALNGYQAIFLLQRLHLEAAALGGAILLTVVVNVGVTLLVAPVVGRISDRLGIRKPFILVAAVILGVGLVVAAMAPDFGVYLIACGIVGLGQGVYFAVELALATQVLPDPENPAKDLGILKIADNLPVSIVAAVAPALLAIGAASAADPNFAALFLAGAVSAIVGGFVILLVKGAR
ncbi:MFS transporter [Microbacterium sp. B2969]|uniref:MFS transporter n=1 Tax=Microbacterium alkaliflavum TaxID=3248839 RepID=A0ABW7QCQ9_9MICO